MVGDWRAMKCACSMTSATRRPTGPPLTRSDTCRYVAAHRIVPRTEYQINLVGGPPRSTPRRLPASTGAACTKPRRTATTFSRTGKSASKEQCVASQTTLTAILEQVLMCCHGYQQESAANFVKVDKPARRCSCSLRSTSSQGPSPPTTSRSIPTPTPTLRSFSTWNCQSRPTSSRSLGCSEVPITSSRPSC